MRLRGGGSLDEVLRLRELVETENACALPGCSIVFDRFIPILRRAMSRGYVKDCYGEYVENGLRHGFDLGVAPGSLKGKRRFRNYSSSLDAYTSVSDAVNARVDKQKTIRLGVWASIREAFEAAFLGIR